MMILENFYPTVEEIKACEEISEEYKKIYPNYIYYDGKWKPATGNIDPRQWFADEMAKRGFPNSSVARIRRGVKP